MKVSIITATVGNPLLKECIESVRAQTHTDVQHLVVVDGSDRWEAANKILQELQFPNTDKGEVLISLPYSIGKDRYNGHRIYGACTYIAEGEYHMWLDEDNLIEPNHIESLVKLTQEKNLDWAFSFRKIIDKDGEIVCLDDCESLGLWPSVLGENHYFVDVNCYFVRKNVAIGMSPVWYRKFREPGQMEIDTAISTILMHKNNNFKYDSTRDYTVKYRVGNTGLSVKKEFFIQGNQRMLQKYNGVLPWKNNK